MVILYKKISYWILDLQQVFKCIQLLVMCKFLKTIQILNTVKLDSGQKHTRTTVKTFDRIAKITFLLLKIMSVA